MKKKITLLLITMISIFNFSNLKSQNIMVEIDGYDGKRDHAYLMVDNIFRLMVEGKWCQDIILKTDNGTIKQDPKNRCEYAFRPSKIEIANIQIFTVEKKDTLLLKEVKVKIEPFPFTLMIGNYHPDCKGQMNIPKSAFLQNKFFLYSLNKDISAYGKLSKFDLKIMRNSKKIYAKTLEGYNKEVDEKLKKDLVDLIQEGDEIFLNQIFYNYFEGFDVEIDAVRILIQ